MKKFDDFERSIKDALDGYDQIKPSKSLWVRISSSLLLLTFMRSAHIQALIIAVVGVMGVSWAILANTSTNNIINSTTVLNKKSTIYTSSAINAKPYYENTNSPLNSETEIIKETSKNNENKIAAVNTENNEIEAREISKIENTEYSNKLVKENTPLVGEPVESVNLENSIDEDVSIASVSLDDKKAIGAKLAVSYIGLSNNNKFVKSTLALSDESNTYSKNNEQIYKLEKNTLLQESISASSDVNSDMQNIDIMHMPLLGIKDHNVNNYNGLNDSYRYIDYRNTALKYNYELFGGIQSNISNIEINTNGDLYIMKDNKSVLYDYNYGANVNLYKNNWFVRIGLNYNKYSEQFVFNTSSVIIDSTVYHYSIVNSSYLQTITGWNTNVGAGMDSIPIYSQTVVETLENKYITEYDSLTKVNLNQYTNEYSIVNIPLLIGYEFDFESYEFDISVGVAWSHIVKLNSYILNPENGKMVNVNENNTLINTNIFNGVISFGAGYKIGANNTIFVRPELYYKLNSIFVKEYVENHNMYQLRCTIGLRYTIR